MMNSAYGMTMKNMRKRMKIRIVTNENDFVKCTSKPTYIGYKKLVKIFMQFMKKRSNKIK